MGEQILTPRGAGPWSDSESEPAARSLLFSEHEGVFTYGDELFCLASLGSGGADVTSDGNFCAEPRELSFFFFRTSL